MDAAHALVFVVKSRGLRGSRFVFKKLFLTMLLADTLKAYHVSTNQSSCDEVKTFLTHNSSSTQPSQYCRDTSVWNLRHYYWAGY